MSGQKEHDTVKAFVNILASQPVTFHDDFQELPEKTLKKVPVLQVSAPGSIISTIPNENHRCEPWILSSSKFLRLQR
jgi:hypothetical protein